MLDGTHLYTERFFPWRPDMKSDYSQAIKPAYARTQRPPKYYIIDFGFSKQYRPEEMPPRESRFSSLGTDNSAPELLSSDFVDPFALDVYTVGNLIRMDFIEASFFLVLLLAYPDLL